MNEMDFPEGSRLDQEELLVSFIKLAIEDKAAFREPRHPDFDECWKQNKRLMWWWANRISKMFQCEWTPREFLGYLVIRMNMILHRWDKEKGAFGTLFGSRLYFAIIQDVLKYESESMAVQNHGKRMTEEERREAGKVKVFYESDLKFYQCPDSRDESWTEEILCLFPDNAALWRFLTHGIPERSANIMMWRYKDDKTGQEIAELLGISKQRVFQIEEATMKCFRNRIKTLECARSLFYGEQR